RCVRARRRPSSPPASGPDAPGVTVGGVNTPGSPQARPPIQDPCGDHYEWSECVPSSTDSEGRRCRHGSDRDGRDMNLQHLRYLVATADEGTMTRAAAALHVAQPALSRGIRGLEVALGITAFERRGRGVTLTPEGAEAVAIARRVLAEVDRLTAIGRLRVCSVRGQATEIASPVIARLVTGGPGR